MNHIFQWEFTLRSQSPLHIGDDDDDLLLDDQGRPFLPGTSWAGACRAYLRDLGLEEKAQELFGNAARQNERHPSKLIFSDGVCVAMQPFDVRPRVALDGASKTVRRNKFEQITVSAGAEFRVKLILRTDTEEDKDYVEQMLDALHRGYIRLGKYKSIGGGQFTISDASYVHYDCTQREDLEAYVHQSKPKGTWEPNSKRDHPELLTFVVTGSTSSPLLIAGAYPNDSQKPDRSPIQALYNGKMQYILPGSSLKGALRHRVQRIARLTGVPQAVVEHMFNGRLLLEDVVLEHPRTKVYCRVAIDPLTGGSKESALTDEETVSGQFTLNMAYRYNPSSTEDKTAVALLLFALRDLAWKRFNLGSGFAIGRGDLSLAKAEMKYKEKRVVFDFQKQTLHDESGWMDGLQQAFETSKGAKTG